MVNLPISKQELALANIVLIDLQDKNGLTSMLKALVNTGASSSLIQSKYVKNEE